MLFLSGDDVMLKRMCAWIIVAAAVVLIIPVASAQRGPGYGSADDSEVSFDPPSATRAIARTLAGQPQISFEPEQALHTEPPPADSQVWKAPAMSASSRIDVMEIKDMDINDVFKILSAKTGLNIIAGRGVQGRVSVFLKDIDVHNALTVILRSNGLAYQENRGVIEVMTDADYQEKFGLRFGVDVITEVIKISYGKVEDLVRAIPPLLTREVGHVEFDANSNLIIVTDIQPKVDAIKKLIIAMDRKQEEVFIEAKIIQVELKDGFEMGIDWSTLLSHNGNGKLQFSSNLGLGAGVSSQAKIGTLTGKDFTAVLSMIETRSKTRIISNPRIAVINNQEAKILIGSTKPYITTSFITPTTGPTTTTETVNFIDVGVKLNVTPTIHDDGFITMKIRPEISTAATSIETSEKNQIPIVETSQVETTVRVKDGVTIIIAGLIKDETNDSKSRVPVLGRVPVIGKVFRHDGQSSTKSEIVIFLTPWIITGDVNTDPDGYSLLKGNKSY
jgi:general secretion pathway protein D